ncbi:MAG: serine hydrolase [Patescibacteria group bacterium]
MKFLRRSVFLNISIFLCGIILGGSVIYSIFTSRTPANTSKLIRENSNEYTYINPLLFTEISSKNTFNEFTSLEKKLRTSIDQFTKDKKADSVSVYIRSLNSGHWTGINEDVLYAPASMLKVALMIAYLKEVESNSEILDKKILYKVISNEKQFYSPHTTFEDGKYYTVRQLIQDMIVESGNNSNLALLNAIDQEELIKVYTDLRIQIPIKDMPEFLSVKSYSTLFRTLYSSTYLNRNISELALDLLAHVSFNDGLKGGVPDIIPVAHKFGERSYINNDNHEVKELHDCGIVYYPQDPYFICVMTRGNDFPSLSNVIQTISKETYTWFSSRISF